MSHTASNVRLGSERVERPAISLPVPSDRTIVLTGFTAARTDDKYEDPIRIRCKREPGFIPAKFFCMVVGIMSRSNRPNEDEFTRRIDSDGTEYEFTQHKGPVTIVAKRLENGKAVAMKVSIDSSERLEPITRTFPSHVVEEIHNLITVMRGIMVHYNVEPVDEASASDEERDWLKAANEEEADLDVDVDDEDEVVAT